MLGALETARSNSVLVSKRKLEKRQGRGAGPLQTVSLYPGELNSRPHSVTKPCSLKAIPFGGGKVA